MSERNTKVTWKFYYPEFFQDIEDAQTVDVPKWFSAENVAQHACQHHWDDHGGWEMVDQGFQIVVVSPEGGETKFEGRHESDIHHRVRSI